MEKTLKQIDCQQHKDLCAALQSFQSGSSPTLTNGNFFSVGRSVLISNSGQVGPEEFLVLMASTSKATTTADVFDPRPENADERRSVADYVSSLERGQRASDNLLHRYVSGLFGKRELFTTWTEDGALKLMFRNSGQDELVSIRQNGKKLYLLNRTHEMGVPFFRFASMAVTP